MLDKYKTNDKQMINKYWTTTEQILDIYWTSTGRVLDKSEILGVGSKLGYYR